MKWWRESAIGALVLLLILSMGRGAGLDGQMDAAHRRVAEARVHVAAMDSALAGARREAVLAQGQIDSLTHRMARVPRRVSPVVVAEVVVDSVDMVSLRVALVDRTTQLRQTVVLLDSAIMRGDSLHSIVVTSIQSFEQHLVRDSLIVSDLQAENARIRTALVRVAQATHRPWYKKAGTRVTHAAVIGLAFWIGSRT